jgi:DtxR family transcriptional regulator, Mn-dependent transcriptional regulator
LEVSESIEMYLVMTALLRRGKQPVPLSRLAEKLSITSVSTNEMCRKLVEKGLVDYQPYKGVTLTTEGNSVAQRILRRRHLWETFLVEKLNIAEQEADEIACQLEHVSSDNLTEQLAWYIEQSAHDSQDARTRRPPFHHERLIRSLSSLSPGHHGLIVSIAADDVVRRFLCAQGIAHGMEVDVLAVGSDGSMLLEMEEHCLALSRVVANHVDVVLARSDEQEEEETHVPIETNHP